MRRRHGHATVPYAGQKHLTRPVRRPTPFADGEQRTDHRANLVVAERIRLRPDEDDVGIPGDVEHPKRPDRRRARPRPAVGREVVLTDQAVGRALHRVDVERSRPGHGVATPQRVRSCVGDPIAVAAAERAEPRVERRRRDLHVTYGDIVRKYAGKAPSPVWVTSVYIKRGGRWRNAVYVHSPAAQAGG